MLGVKTKLLEECTFSSIENQFSRSDMGIIRVMRRCLRTLMMWKKPWFLAQGLVLVASCCHKTLKTDASLTGWDAVLDGCSIQSLWRGNRLSWHINYLEMMAVFLALKYFFMDLRDYHVLVHPDNTLLSSYINDKGRSAVADWSTKFSSGPRASCSL